MRSVVRPSGVLSVVLAGLFLLASCAREESPILGDLRGTWMVADAVGVTEKVEIEHELIRWRAGTEEEYSCPYRLISYHAENGTVDLRMKSKKRTGADAWIEYKILFSADRSSFEMSHSGDVTDGIFRASRP